MNGLRAFMTPEGPRFEVTHTASDWQLFTSMSGAEDVGVFLSQKLTSLLNNSALTEQEVAEQFDDVWKGFHRYGARDTEPNHLADATIEAAYDEQKNWR